MGAFFPLDLLCEIHRFPHQFPIAWENAVKSIKLGEPRKLVPIFSANLWILFFHQIPILHIVYFVTT